MTFKMRPYQTLTQAPHFMVNAIDRRGRPIEPCVLLVARDIAPQAVSYAQKFLADPCVAVNLLEEAAATVSEAVLAKQVAALTPIRDLRPYLYRAFLRRVSAERRTEIRQEEGFEDRLRLQEDMSFEEKFEARLLLKQILCMCDRNTLWIIWERIEGRSWEEIAGDMLMTNHAARLHCSRALRAIREAFETNPQAYIENLRRAERKRQWKVRLITRLENLFALLSFRGVRAKTALGVRFRISCHEREDMLADADNLFS